MTLTATVEWERSLADGAPVAGMDEVGRGALAGPVAVGLCVSGAGMPPPGLADSKLLTPKRRQQLFSPIWQWSAGAAVGMATAAEVDRFGISSALQLAGLRALESIPLQCRPATIILDGSHNWLAPAAGQSQWQRWVNLGEPKVVTRLKADMTCTAVAAASIIAKVARDQLMATLPDPGYAWAQNKGYAASAHREGIARLGVSPLHRSSWKLPGLDYPDSPQRAYHRQIPLWPEAN